MRLTNGHHTTAYSAMLAEIVASTQILENQNPEGLQDIGATTAREEVANIGCLQNKVEKHLKEQNTLSEAEAVVIGLLKALHREYEPGTYFSIRESVQKAVGTTNHPHNVIVTNTSVDFAEIFRDEYSALAAVTVVRAAIKYYNSLCEQCQSVGSQLPLPANTRTPRVA